MKAIVTKDSYNNRWRFEFQTDNNKGIADSRATYANARNAIEAVKLIAGKRVRIEVREDGV